MGLLDGDLAELVGGALSFLFLDATLSRDSYGAPARVGEPGARTSTAYPCKAIHEDWSLSELGSGAVLASDRKVLVLASTLAVAPLPGDRVTLRGETVTVVPAGTAGAPPVETDPARACWTLRCRR